MPDKNVGTRKISVKKSLSECTVLGRVRRFLYSLCTKENKFCAATACITVRIFYPVAFSPVFIQWFLFVALQGGIHGKISLTAYVVASLLETGVTSEVTKT